MLRHYGSQHGHKGQWGQGVSFANSAREVKYCRKIPKANYQLCGTEIANTEGSISSHRKIHDPNSVYNRELSRAKRSWKTALSAAHLDQQTQHAAPLRKPACHKGRSRPSSANTAPRHRYTKIRSETAASKTISYHHLDQLPITIHKNRAVSSCSMPFC
ncbi:hypothetical protein DL768_005792 [Monosporascus sp. mg162]|nr:hypothetical protein DL768_005792 [Monosporascus sp. mg162]